MINLIKKIINKSFPIRRILLTMPSRILFGNTISLTNNIKPYFNKLNFLKTSDYKKTFHSSNNSELKNLGFKKIKYNLDSKLIEIISDKFEQNILNDSVSKFSTNNKSRYLINPLKYIPEIEDLEFLWEKDVKDFYAGNYRVHKYNAWRIYSDSSYNENKKNFLYSNFWHFDDAPKNLLKVFILLSDNVGKDSGATRVIDVSTSKKLTRTFKFVDYALPSISNRLVDEYVYSNNKINYFEGNKGDAFICNTPRVLHAATIPEEGKVRDVFQIELYPA
jgi:hypothetical protein